MNCVILPGSRFSRRRKVSQYAIWRTNPLSLAYACNIQYTEIQADQHIRIAELGMQIRLPFWVLLFLYFLISTSFLGNSRLLTHNAIEYIQL